VARQLQVTFSSRPCLQDDLAMRRHTMVPSNMQEMATQFQAGTGLWRDTYSVDVVAKAQAGERPHDWNRLQLWTLKCALTLAALELLPRRRLVQLEACAGNPPLWMAFFVTWSVQGESDPQCLVLRGDKAALKTHKVWRHSDGYYGVKLGPDALTYLHRLVCWGQRGRRPADLAEEQGGGVSRHEVDHTCGSPQCVCGPHLDWVTHQTNMARSGVARKRRREYRLSGT
jgi:hypothetical protein